MRRHLALALSVCVVGVLSACAPTFNWRELPIGSTALTALFPCKPQTVTRTVPIANQAHELAMRSCDAAGVTFAVAHAVLADPAQAPSVLSAWRASALAGVGADAVSVSSQPPQGLPALPQLQVLRAARAGGDVQALSLLGVWFAKDSDVFAVFMMAPAIPADVAESFFAGLRLR